MKIQTMFKFSLFILCQLVSGYLLHVFPVLYEGDSEENANQLYVHRHGIIILSHYTAYKVANLVNTVT